MNSKMTTNSQLSTTDLKNKNKNKLSKQVEQEWTQRKVTWGVISREREEENVQGIRSINDRYKIDRGGLRTVFEMEKPKNLYVRPMVMN